MSPRFLTPLFRPNSQKVKGGSPYLLSFSKVLIENYYLYDKQSCNMQQINWLQSKQLETQLNNALNNDTLKTMTTPVPYLLGLNGVNKQMLA